MSFGQKGWFFLGRRFRLKSPQDQVPNRYCAEKSDYTWQKEGCKCSDLLLRCRFNHWIFVSHFTLQRLLNIYRTFSAWFQWEMRHQPFVLLPDDILMLSQPDWIWNATTKKISGGFSGYFHQKRRTINAREKVVWVQRRLPQWSERETPSHLTNHDFKHNRPCESPVMFCIICDFIVMWCCCFPLVRMIWNGKLYVMTWTRASKDNYLKQPRRLSNC